MPASHTDRATFNRFESLERRSLFTFTGPLPTASATIHFEVNAILADPHRNRVYLSDKTNLLVRVIDTSIGRQVAMIHVAGTPGQLAITPDGLSLAVALPDTGKVQVLSPVSFQSIRTIDVGASLFDMAAGTGGKIYGVSVSGNAPFIKQYDLTTGAAGATLSNTNYGMLFADPTGTRLYARNGFGGTSNSLVVEYDISDPASVTTAALRSANLSNPSQLYADRDAGRIYTTDGGVYGLGTIDMTSGFRANWNFPSGDAYGRGVAGTPGSAYVYGLSGSSVVQFVQATGEALYRYNAYSPRSASLVVTPNENMMYVRQYWNGTGSAGGLGGYDWNLYLIGGGLLTIVDTPAVITGSVFNDLDLNGTRGGGETSGVDARVYVDLNDNGQFDDVGPLGEPAEPSTLLDDAGDGAYRLELPLGAGGTHTVRVENRSDSDHHSIRFTAAATRTVTVDDGDEVAAAAIGAAYGATITGQTFYDENENAQRDAGDNVLARPDVFLDYNDNGFRDDDEPWQLGGATPDYGQTFSFDVAAGTYHVRLLNADASRYSSPVVQSISVSADDDATVSFAVLPLRQMSGNLFIDNDADGRHDAGEPAYAGVRVWLDLNGDNRYAPSEPSAVSDVDGSYSLRSDGNVSAAIRFLVDSTKLKSSANRSRVSFDSPDDAVTADFGLYRLSSIAVNAFLDRDRNRRHNKGDAWRANVIVFIDANNNGKQDKREAFALTDALGNAIFENLTPGSYTVSVRVPSKQQATTRSTFIFDLASGEQRALTVGMV